MGFFDFIPAVKNNEEAERLLKRAKKMVDEAQREIEIANTQILEVFEEYGEEKLHVLSTTIYDFVENFKKIKNVELSESNIHEDIKQIKLTKAEFEEMEQASFNIKQITASGITAMGAGAIAGVAAYGGVGALATASTGTAIASLSGAAATNATLAWLGGGSLAAGGGGMALGAAVLGGIVAGPILTIGYGIYHAKSVSNLAEAKKTELEADKFATEISLSITKMNAIIRRVDQMLYVLKKLDQDFRKHVSAMKDILNKYGEDYASYPNEEKQKIYLSVIYAQAIKALLDVNILTQRGMLNSKTETVVVNTEKFLEEHHDKNKV